MLKNVPKILTPDLLKYLDEMGHNDVLVIGDGNFPGVSLAKANNGNLVRYDATGTLEIMKAILEMIPLDSYVKTPVVLMEKEPCDETLDIPIWREIKDLVKKHDSRGEQAIGYMNRFDFYESTKKASVVVQTGEEATYACVLIRKGVIK